MIVIDECKTNLNTKELEFYGTNFSNKQEYFNFGEEVSFEFEEKLNEDLVNFLSGYNGKIIKRTSVGCKVVQYITYNQANNWTCSDIKANTLYGEAITNLEILPVKKAKSKRLQKKYDKKYGYVIFYNIKLSLEGNDDVISR